MPTGQLRSRMEIGKWNGNSDASGSGTSYGLHGWGPNTADVNSSRDRSKCVFCCCPPSVNPARLNSGDTVSFVSFTVIENAIVRPAARRCSHGDIARNRAGTSLMRHMVPSMHGSRSLWQTRPSIRDMLVSHQGQKFLTPASVSMFSNNR